MKRKGRLPLNSRDPVGRLHHRRCGLSPSSSLMFRAAVCAEQRRGLAHAPAARGEQVERGRGAQAEELVEVAPVDDERLEVLDDERGRRARPAVDQRRLAEEVPVSRRLEDDAVARVVLEEELDHARAHDEERIARVARVEEVLARRAPSRGRGARRAWRAPGRRGARRRGLRPASRSASSSSRVYPGG